MQTEEDVNRIKSLEKEAAHLKQLIGSQHVELVYLKELVKLAKEKLGEDFEKNQIQVLMRLKTESVKAGITMEQAYKFVGITRQGFHEKIKRHEREKS
ncbi:MAG: hypothetical protein IPH94_02570 [Saprospiraceae bacterium]|nr:hypothetical protein [Saprospiraceae bacterium]